MNGALIVNKPAGITSFYVIRKLKKHYSLRKIGHAGTLDPMAVGVLVILLGKATKLQYLFLESEKKYSGYIQLGIQTDTDDITGSVITEDSNLQDVTNQLSVEYLDEFKKGFTGLIQQTPPIYSAIKVGGQRSYSLARKGKAQELKPREINIYSLDLQFEQPDRLIYQVHCSKGTYVRSLARDIGKRLGTCASLGGICRDKVGQFSLNDAISLDDLLEGDKLEANLLTLETLLSFLPDIDFDETDLERLRYGDQEVLMKEPCEGALREISKQGHKAAVILDKNTQVIGLLEKVQLLNEQNSSNLNTWKLRFLV